ncbi:erythromycin esterase family protein [Streptomyces sp. NPDC059717]|uniref:erythromycin esterase family protein n=1 Tax=Streptomyces sp. NPDC059717 TaxID=3346922 RepID=UPI0036A4C650
MLRPACRAGPAARNGRPAGGGRGTLRRPLRSARVPTTGHGRPARVLRAWWARSLRGPGPVFRALVDSVKDMFHQVGEKEFLLPFNRTPLAADALRKARLERATGVIYPPQTERQSHYFRARISDQFDGVIHIDGTRAVEPPEHTAEWQEREVPEIYPFAILWLPPPYEAPEPPAPCQRPCTLNHTPGLNTDSTAGGGPTGTRMTLKAPLGFRS